MLFVGFRELLAELASYRVIFGVVHVVLGVVRISPGVVRVVQAYMRS